MVYQVNEIDMNEAIKLAIEGGWRPAGLNCDGHSISWIKQAAVNRSKFKERYILDVLFWQALGKSLGWVDTASISYAYHKKHGENLELTTTMSGGSFNKGKVGMWHYQMHRFIDHLAKGGDVDKFFEELLNNK